MGPFINPYARALQPIGPENRLFNGGSFLSGGSNFFPRVFDLNNNIVDDVGDIHEVNNTTFDREVFEEAKQTAEREPTIEARHETRLQAEDRILNDFIPQPSLQTFAAGRARFQQIEEYMSKVIAARRAYETQL